MDKYTVLKMLTYEYTKRWDKLNASQIAHLGKRDHSKEPVVHYMQKWHFKQPCWILKWHIKPGKLQSEWQMNNWSTSAPSFKCNYLRCRTSKNKKKIISRLNGIILMPLFLKPLLPSILSSKQTWQKDRVPVSVSSLQMLQMLSSFRSMFTNCSSSSITAKKEAEISNHPFCFGSTFIVLKKIPDYHDTINEFD